MANPQDVGATHQSEGEEGGLLDQGSGEGEEAKKKAKEEHELMESLIGIPEAVIG